MQMILFTYACILMKTLENENNRGHNNESVSHEQYLLISVYPLQSVNAFFDRSLNVLSDSFTVHIRFVRYISVTRTVLSVISPLLVRYLSRIMRYSYVLCVPYNFRDDLHRHRDDFLQRINIFCIFSVRSASVSAIR